MMHDRNGREVKQGDLVCIPARVLSTHASEEYCNADLELEYPMPPYTHKDKLSAINTKQFFVVDGITGSDGQSYFPHDEKIPG
jgi:hypothetical protein